jgi:hypothetical protein
MKRKAGIKDISRRKALKELMAGAGATAALPALGQPVLAMHARPQAQAVASEMALGCAQPPDPALTSPDWKPKFFDAHQNETVMALSGLIIPDTDTPGAKTVQVNRFIDLLLAAESPETQKRYYEALAWLDGHCLAEFSKPFTSLDPREQEYMLTLLTQPNDDPDIRHGIELFRVLKGSIVQAYYTSTTGLLKELNYQTNPYQTGMPLCKHPGGHGV